MLSLNKIIKQRIVFNKWLKGSYLKVRELSKQRSPKGFFKSILNQNKEEISSTFCVLPWMECIVGPTASMKLCCIANTYVKNKEGGSYMAQETSLSEYWNSFGLRKVRQKMLKGEKISACSHCYYQESVGKPSYRQSFNREWLSSKHREDILQRVEESRKNKGQVTPPPLYLDIRPGNLCNLKCRMCNPGNSSKLYQEQKQLLKSHPNEIKSLIDTSYFAVNEKDFHNWYKSKEIWDGIYKWLPEVKKLYFTGGEPTLIKQNWELIDHLTKKGYSKDIDLVFNINCTSIPDKLLNTFNTFKNVTITFSVDGLGQVQEYIRHPSQWKETEANVIKVLKNKTQNSYFYFSPVVQVYNILNLPDFLRYIDSLKEKYEAKIGVSIILCTIPKFFDIAFLPSNVKKQALRGIEEYEKSCDQQDQFLLEQLNAIKNILKFNKKSTKEMLKKLYKYTVILDGKRSNNFKTALPELNRLLNEDAQWNN